MLSINWLMPLINRKCIQFAENNLNYRLVLSINRDMQWFNRNSLFWPLIRMVMRMVNFASVLNRFGIVWGPLGPDSCQVWLYFDVNLCLVSLGSFLINVVFLWDVLAFLVKWWHWIINSWHYFSIDGISSY